MSSVIGNPSRERVGPNWLNLLIFHFVWLVCVLANDVLAVVATVLFFGIHSKYYVQQTKEWLIIVVFSFAGLVFESLQMNQGQILFQGASSINLFNTEVLIPPVWLVCLWLSFATTLGHGMYWFADHLKLAALGALITVPVSYYFGALISNSTLVNGVFSLLIEGVIWSLLFPIGLIFVRKMKGQNQ